MLPFMYYLLKVMICSGIMYCYYLLALRNKRFHQHNRFYLLLAVALSFVIPFISIGFWRESVQQSAVMKMITIINEADIYVTGKSKFSWDWNNITFVAFAFISLGFLLSLIVSLIKIFAIIKWNPKKIQDKVCFVFSDTPGTPFSFFKYIFWNREIDIESDTGKQMLKHELVHVHEKHSADKLFLNLMLVIGWYNPFIWLVRRELNMIHEFIADQKAVTDGDTNSFAMMLLKTTYPAQSFMLVNSFFHSPIKRRLLMLTTSNKARFSYLSRLIILPLFLFVFALFAFKIKESNNAKRLSSFNKPSGVLTINAAKDILATLPAAAENESPAEFPGGADAWRRYLEKNLNANVLAENKAPSGQYSVKLVFNVHKDGSISNVVAETRNGYGTEEETIRFIKNGPKWIPAKKDGIAIDSRVKQTITFAVSEE
jgi:beta-lactamase regulating signal transducer with metallopeptidase domain